MNTNPAEQAPPLDWNKQQAAVNAAFKALRKAGIVARRGKDVLEADIPEGALGWASTEARDEKRWRSEPSFRYGPGHLFISYGPHPTASKRPKAEYDAAVLDVGQRIAAALTAAGAVYEWDGTMWGCIRVVAPA